MHARLSRLVFLLPALLMLLPASSSIATWRPLDSSVQTVSYSSERAVYAHASSQPGGTARATTTSSHASSVGKGAKRSHHSQAATSRSHGRRIKCLTCPRDSHGRIKRSPEAKREFRKSHPCPSTGKTSGPCPGYVIDHIKALKRDGADRPYNMQWQTKEAAKAKDKIE